MTGLERERHRMVEEQLVRRGVRDADVLAAMREAPREAFVPDKLREFAYEDRPLPIEAGQTISQPLVVAMMIEAADVGVGDRVLEIGAGSGYAAAVLSRIADRVYAIERHDELTTLAAERLRRLGYDTVELRTGDGTLGWPEAAPFDAIIVSASAPDVPRALMDQLVIGGALIVPVGAPHVQHLIRVRRVSDSAFNEEELGAVAFVPLIGAHGWSEQA